MADQLQLLLELVGRDSGALALLQHAQQGASSLAGAAGTLGKAMLGVGAVAGGALVAGIGASITSAAGFEQRMSSVKAVSGATEAELKALSGLALQLGKDTSFSASQAAAGIEELVKGGLTIPDIMDGAASATLNLAAAGGVSLPDAATIAANALAEFNLKGSDMAHVADLIAGAANASALDVGQFKFSLQAAGAVAATVGFSFDDLAQGIAIMGKAGITGSDAGTSLKTMMLNLTPATKAAYSEMRALGIVTADGANRFFDAQGKVKSMAEVAGILQQATAKLTQEQKLSTLQTLFGTDAVRAAAVLAKEGASGFNDMAAAMEHVTAAAVGAERMNNLKGDIQALQGSVETAQITFGTAFLPLIRGATQGATSIVNGLIPVVERLGPLFSGEVLNAVQSFIGALSGDWQPAPGIGQFADIAGRLGLVIGDVKNGVLSFIGALKGDWQPAPGISTFATIAGNLGLVVADVRDGVISFIGAIKGDWQPAPGISTFATIAGNLGLIIGDVKNGVESFVGALKGDWQPAPGISEFSTTAGKLGTLLKDTVGPAISSFVSDPMKAINGAFDDAKKLMEPFAPTAGRIGTAIDAITTAIGKLVPEPIATYLSKLATGATSSDTLKAASDLLKGAFDLLVIAVNGVSGGISTAIDRAKDIAAAIGDGIQKTKDFTAALLDNKPVMALLSGLTGATAGAAFALAAGYAASLVPLIPLTVAAWAHAIASGAETVAIWALVTASDAAAVAMGALNLVMSLNPIVGLIVLIGALVGVLIYAYNNSKEFRDQVEGLWAGLKAGWQVLTDIDQKIRSAWNSAIESAKQVILDFVKNTWNWGANAVQGFIDGITGKKQAAASAASAVAAAADEAARTRLDMHSPSRVFMEIGRQTIEGFVAGVGQAKAKAAAETASAVFGAIKAGTEALKGLAGFQAPPVANIDSFVASTRQVVGAMGESAALMSKQFLERTGLYAESAGKALGIVGSGVAGLMALNTYAAPSADAIAVFKENTQQLVESLGDSAATMGAGFIEHAAAYADAAGKGLGLLTAGVAGLNALNSLRAPTADAVAVFKVLTEFLITSLGDSAALLSRDYIAHAGLYSETAGKGLAILVAGVAGLNALNGLKAPTADAVAVFKFLTEFLIRSLGDSAALMSRDYIAHAGLYAEAAGKGLGILAAGVAGLAKLADFRAPGEAAASAFKFSVEFLVRSLGDSAATMKAEFLTHANAFSDGAGKALGVLGTGVDALTKLNDFVAPSEQAINSFLAAALYVVRRLGETAATLQTEGIAQTTAFSAAATAALGAAKAGIDAFLAMGKLVVPSREAIDALLFGMVAVVQRMGELATLIGAEGVQRAVDFAKACQAVFAGLKAALELFKELAKYQHTPVKALEDLMDQMKVALKLAGDAVSQSESFLRRAEEFKRTMQQAARDFAAGLAAGKATPDLGATLPSASLPGRADGGPVMAGQSYLVGERGPELFVPRSSGQIVPNGAGVGGTTLVVNVTVQGSVQTQSDLTDAIWRGLQSKLRANGSLGLGVTP